MTVGDSDPAEAVIIQIMFTSLLLLSIDILICLSGMYGNETSYPLLYAGINDY